MVVSSAVMGASVVALSSATILPDDLTGVERDNSLLSVTDPVERGGQNDYGVGISVDAYAPDVWLLPIRDQYHVTSRFDIRWLDGAERHWGIDLAAAPGTPIYAVHAGTVTVSRSWGNYGLGIEIDHGDGVTTRYGHASALLVTVGQQVQAGQLIARVGSTGRSTGPHLHFEVRVYGGFYDPAQWMKEHGVDLYTKQEEANGGVVLG
jgi:murein DD-endopeptidase MepM/ murein hydrolase activator NlpD